MSRSDMSLKMFKAVLVLATLVLLATLFVHARQSQVENPRITVSVHKLGDYQQLTIVRIGSECHAVWREQSVAPFATPGRPATGDAVAVTSWRIACP